MFTVKKKKKNLEIKTKIQLLISKLKKGDIKMIKIMNREMHCMTFYCMVRTSDHNYD